MTNDTTTKRARLGPAPGALKEVLGDPGADDVCDNLLQPLHATRGIVFPYTPQVMFGGNANYGNFHFTHSNFPYYQYQNSQPSEIQVTGIFTAQTNEEARYLLAVLKFLRGSTMIEFGTQAAQKGQAGTPPPVLRFNYMGSHMFNNTPVVVTAFNYLLEDTLDYVEVVLPGDRDSGSIINLQATEGESIISAKNKTYVPTRIVITTVLQIQPNPRDVRDNFDLEKFKRGDLVNKGYM